MMMKIAGGPGLVSPLDDNERKRPLPRTTWVAVGVVVLAHVGIGAALYSQHFETLQADPLPDPTPPVIVHLIHPIPKPTENTRPPAPNPPIHDTRAPLTPTDVLPTPKVDDPADNPGPLVNLGDGVPDGTGGTATTPPRPPVVITSPQWVSRPNAAQMERAYPERALDAGIGGAVGLRCQARIDGTLSDCAVTSETPAGRGFGRAGLSLSRFFRLSPRLEDGQAVDGAVVAFNVRFDAAP